MTFADPPHDRAGSKFTTQEWSHPCAQRGLPRARNSGLRGRYAWRQDVQVPKRHRPTWGSYIVQFPSCSEWVELSAFGSHVTIDYARAIAERISAA
jgi:hypothetical protein